MLEITNLRDGAVLNRNFGIETDDYLEIKVEGIADCQADVRVNGKRACRHDRNFSAAVRLTERINEITVTADSYYGRKSLTLTVVWDKKSYKRYNFFFDDCVFFLHSLAVNHPASMFDELFLGRLKKIHDKYGTFFTLNIFYHDDHHDFSICDMPEDYKAEFQANCDWLKLSFHAKSEFPDRPYQHADKAKLAADFDEVYNEICRFAGKECFIAPTVIHWAMTNPENFSVLKERGTNALAGGFIGLATYIGETHSIQVTDIGYHYEKEVAKYVCDSHVFYDRYHDIFLFGGVSTCNLDEIEVLEKKFAELAENPYDAINLASHEQYSYPDYFNYLPDHLDRIETACRLATEAGYKPAWFVNGILGNNEWDK